MFAHVISRPPFFLVWSNFKAFNSNVLQYKVRNCFIISEIFLKEIKCIVLLAALVLRKTQNLGFALSTYFLFRKYGPI